MAMLQGVNVGGYSSILFRRTYQDLALSGALMDRAHQWWAGTDAHWMGDAKTFRFPSGARIAFGYLDGPRDHLRYQSAEFQGIGFDEVSQFGESQAMYLTSRLRAPLSFPQWLPMRWRAGTNPGGIGHDWLQKRYRIPTLGATMPIEIWRGDRLQRAFVPSLAVDNPGLDVEAYMRQLAELDPITRAQLERGEWLIDGSGLVYYCYSPSSCNVQRLPRDIPAHEWRRVLGVDFASAHDKTAFAISAYSPHEETVYLEHTEEHSRMSPQEASKYMSVLTEQWASADAAHGVEGGFDSIVGDAGGLGAAYMLEMTKHWAIPINPAEKQHKLAYIKLFNGELHDGRLKIVEPECESWMTQARTLMWQNGQQLKENQSQPNDSTDAALYSWRECRHYTAVDRYVDPVELIDDPIERSMVERRREEDFILAGIW
jgi:hypothetical protein